jgi:hypothetical protein
VRSQITQRWLDEENPTSTPIRLPTLFFLVAGVINAICSKQRLAIANLIFLFKVFVSLYP